MGGRLGRALQSQVTIDTKRKVWDVVIVGAGPAGLSAALVLGRCWGSVFVCDRGTPQSWASKAMHSFISHDGVAPSSFRRRARKELSRYCNVHYWRGEVKRLVRGDLAFGVYLQRSTTAFDPSVKGSKSSLWNQSRAHSRRLRQKSHCLATHRAALVRGSEMHRPRKKHA